MARPIKNNADYFPHDADMRNDEKTLALRNKYGFKGYCIWIFTLEKMADSNNFFIPMTEAKIELLSGDFQLPVKELQEIWDYCCAIELFQKKDNELHCENLEERLVCVTQKRQRMRFVRDSVAQTPQSKVKESKGKESKVKKSKVYVTDYHEVIKIYYSLYIEKFDQKPRIDAIEQQAIKEILKHYSLDEVRENLGKYFVSNDDFIHSQGYSLKWFQRAIKAFMTGYTHPKKKSSSTGNEGAVEGFLGDLEEGETKGTIEIKESENG